MDTIRRRMSIANNPMHDSIVEKVLAKYQQRSDRGVAKYGVTLDRTDLDFKAWLTHLQEELMDATLYIEKVMEVWDGKVKE